MTLDKDHAKQLLAEIVALRNDVAEEGAATFRRWRPKIERRAFAGSAYNFAHYLALRERDLRLLQRRLMALGLSSLGRVEGRVIASLDAVTVALAALAGVSPPAGVRTHSERQFFRGETRLGANAYTIFGPQRPNRSGRILVTLDADAGDDLAVMRSLVAKGADAARINCAHDDAACWGRMIANIHETSRQAGRAIPILMDIAGPKPRTGAALTPSDRERLIVGDELLLCRGAQLCDGSPQFRTTCTLPEIVDQLKVGDAVALDDGKLLGRIAREERGGFVVAIEAGRLKGLKLKPGRGLTFPNVDLKLEPLTDKDRQDLDFVLSNADMVGYSFVESAEHVEELQRELAARRQDWRKFPLVAKIETARALRNLPEIIVAAAGRQPLAVMIARGDLAVGIGFERVAEMQEEMLWLCEAAHIPAIWATQVLEGLVAKGVPSRGEMTDAAMAGRAEVVMLNKGPQLAAGVAALDRLLERMGEHQVKKTPTLRALHTWSRPGTTSGRLETTRPAPATTP
jgi:pyruvate kinase